ncbi:hypothetical protein [Chlorogloeopsis sp. ULAP02]|uniref:hypothetical protein n=1 Tax=Chlorogloeopsis sp. ULAP02 TaxID=3107926 RepID=UPI0031354BF2
MEIVNNISGINFLWIFGIVFLFIAVIGQAKLFFAEINPGCFGRSLALIIALFCLTYAAVTTLLPVEASDLLRNYLTQQIQQFMGFIHW